ncbi:P-loop containing nucleoside triphosphate hydrolase protein [Pelagophyceae sp. CCMP2097]|nr:P-loop containing nucleoside triphosphate hydrolase protein [Pelagophyceae sp. CCMP2097]|mmetsp:Transcript_5779/g.18324  ORF Transcript_5779/g.18324 Transcript_5779/m.18324 type:complete len:966 (-) Transcript_5779:30-2927(-)
MARQSRSLAWILALALVRRGDVLVVVPRRAATHAQGRRPAGHAPTRRSIDTVRRRASVVEEVAEPIPIATDEAFEEPAGVPEEALVVGRPDLDDHGQANLVFEGDYVVHFERGMCQYLGRVNRDHDGEGGAPILLRFSERTVALEASEARYLTRVRGAADATASREDATGPLSSAATRDGFDALSQPILEAPSPGSLSLSSAPKLSKWGKPEKWHALRQKAAEVSAEHARELVTMAAARSRRVREPSAPLSAADVALMDAGLGAALTQGQLRCVQDVEEDMCRRLKPMDRLVFGDVGYGKTEIALRACAVACRAGRQVAVLAPTTALAAQHYAVMKRRLGPLGIRVDLLVSAAKASGIGRDDDDDEKGLESDIDDEAGTKPVRGSARNEMRRVRASLASGETDVAIGTHALLAPRQTWRRLGLAVIDEEQRFGVTQKERLKEACVDVDVLTLSATPIPRTLGAALAGLRDTSELPDPPPGRAGTRSVVAADSPGRGSDDARLAALLKKELDRGGQAFFVVPRIADIPSARKRLEKILRMIKHPLVDTPNTLQLAGAAPVEAAGFEATVADEDDYDDLDSYSQDAGNRDGSPVLVAHGRIPDAPSVILDFARGNNETHPVLLATTLVENGLDLPRVNTIVIQDAHKFGLASLHQLRGRVGRSDKEAIAVFLYPRTGVPPSARARLRAVADSKRSTGAEVAKRDLEIRGAGALLGTRQSGKVSRAIGDELYTKMLKAELERIRALRVEPTPGDGASTKRLPAAAYVAQLGIAAPDTVGAALETIAAAFTTTQVARAARALQPLTPELKAALKLRYLEIYATRLGLGDFWLQDPADAPLLSPDERRPTKKDVDPEAEERAAPSAFVTAPVLEPETWDLLRREVPPTLRQALRFDEPMRRVEVVRLGALKPLKQVDFLLEVVRAMSAFLDRVQHVTAEVPRDIALQTDETDENAAQKDAETEAAAILQR